MVGFSPGAIEVWAAFNNEIEARMAKGGDLAAIRHFAAKAAQHAARLAAVIESFCDFTIQEFSLQAMRCGETLVRHYLGEAQRIYANVLDNIDLKLAETVLDWLDNRGRSLWSF